MATRSIINTDGFIDYDLLYEDDEENASTETQGSVIRNLLGQLLFGTSLTDVVLPTFVLERRSLLEMYSDFFSHPDLFVRIADEKSAKDRMVAVLRWYLSTFHVGRKKTFAKKPYNPIIGETFQCHWNVPGMTDTSLPSVSDGPVPWCRRDQLSFLAEQVSHHPPISAFYAEHVIKRISFCAHIWTESKFLGFCFGGGWSIGVNNVGQGRVYLMNHDEEYVVTFPDAYGRSVFNVPWLELGGNVSITCEKTGYRANVRFHEKTILGKKNEVSAEVLSPGETKPFLKVKGKWNGVMKATAENGTCYNFVDTTTMEIVKKQVRPISEQGEFESRKLWKDVTLWLKLGDEKRATVGRNFLEDRQRREEREREEANEEWKNKFFHEEDETWMYDKPLHKRLVRQPQ